MSHKAIFEALDTSLREMARSVEDGGLGPAWNPMSCTAAPYCRPFGGKTVVLAGHWAQCLPVVARGSRADITAACVFNAAFWPDVSVFRLTENF
eukprot:COSAG05_NODE_2467_length_3028_cov_4.291909_1_plen_93_part_10